MLILWQIVKKCFLFPFYQSMITFWFIKFEIAELIYSLFARNFYLTHTYRIAASKQVGIFQPFVSLEYFCKFTCSYKKLDKTPISRITDFFSVFFYSNYSKTLYFFKSVGFSTFVFILILVLKVTLPTSQIMQGFHRK